MDFKDLNLRELDKNLPVEEQEEWNAIYASRRSASIISGRVQGVDYHTFDMKDANGKAHKQHLSCLIVIKYRVKIIIPETEVWFTPQEETHWLRSMCGGTVDYVITHIDRENGFAVASRKLALKQLRFASRRYDPLGKTVDIRIIAVGKNVCTAHYSGYDVLLSQRDISYSVVGDLRECMYPGDVKKAVITEWNPTDGVVRLSIKATTRHPFDGIEVRHPIGCTRAAKIIGKYNGGVFCRLFDGMTDILCTYNALNYDGDFHSGDKVEILIQKYNTEKRLAYGKILRKMF
jgi:ribosomal protein S1